MSHTDATLSPQHRSQATHITRPPARSPESTDKTSQSVYESKVPDSTEAPHLGLLSSSSDQHPPPSMTHAAASSSKLAVSPLHSTACSRSASASSSHSSSSKSSSIIASRNQSLARTEASAKMRATLSASTEKPSSNPQKSFDGVSGAPFAFQDQSAADQPAPASASSASSAVNTTGGPASGPSPMLNGSTSPSTFLMSQASESSPKGLMPVPEGGVTLPAPATPANLHTMPYMMPQQFNGQLPAAPVMSSPSRSGSLPGPAVVAGAGVAGSSNSPNGRYRSQTATLSNGSGHPAVPYQMHGVNGTYAGTRAGMRTSPQMRAMSQSHVQVPHLPGMGVNMMGSPSAPSSIYNGGQATSPNHAQMLGGPNWERHTAELTNCIVAFLSPILPTEEEYRIKEATRRQLERLANRVAPGAKLLAFGSMANGFALRNSDMDLCCLLSKQDGAAAASQHSASELVEMLGQLIREETDFKVMPLPKARIPIIKINRSPTADLPYEIACDIGFENRLALENTRLLLSYAMVDPPRLRTLVLFLKVWTKRRKLNSPYTGTLSSYGYTLMVLFFLTHVKKPAVLPNLQRIPPTREMKPEEMELNGNNIYFYDDVASLRKEWSSQNTENVGELLIDFFRYFSKEFSYARDVISLKTETGLLTKESRNWNSELCIEDPFQEGYNVSRTVTKDGLYTIRGEFMRASRILTNVRGQKISILIAELCEEREDGLSRAPDGPSSAQRHHHMHAGGFYGGPRSYYMTPRRFDGSNVSGYGGSFVFEQMARNLSQGVALPPTAAMLAPLSRTHGLSPKPQPPRFAGQANEPAFSSAQSDSGGYAPLDFSRQSIGHVSARTSPSFKHALPSAFPGTNGAGAQEAFAYGAEISFGPEAVQSTQDDIGGTPRSKTSRSFSETLNRSKSLPRPGVMNGNGMVNGVSPAAAQAYIAGVPASTRSGFYDPMMASSQPSHPSNELESRMATLSVQQPVVSGTRRLSSSSHASSSAQYDSNSGSTMQYSSASSPWSIGHPATDSSLHRRNSNHHHQPSHQPSSNYPDSHALVQEYLRRTAQVDDDAGDRASLVDPSCHSQDQHPGQNDDAESVISEATLDELARISTSELEDSDILQPASGGATASKNVSPRTSIRLPDSIIAQAKNRRKAQQNAAVAATAAATSGIARKDKEAATAAATAAAAETTASRPDGTDGTR